MLSNPLYVRADKNVYAYFQTLGFEIIDDVEAYDGVHGIFIHDNADGGKYVKVGYHEELVDAETWLRVQDKKARSIWRKGFHFARKIRFHNWMKFLVNLLNIDFTY